MLRSGGDVWLLWLTRLVLGGLKGDALVMAWVADIVQLVRFALHVRLAGVVVDAMVVIDLVWERRLRS